MNPRQIIQHFFTRMRCNYCSSHFKAEGVDLVKEDGSVFLVDINCSHCERSAGLAMVSLDRMDGEGGFEFEPRFKDPELTPAELDRLALYEPISENDVLDAHHFFQNLDSNWQQYLPKTEEMRRRGTVLEMEAD